MLLYPQAELEEEGPPSRKEMFWALAAIPVLLLQITVWSLRVIRGFRGEPLQLSSSLGIEVRPTDPSWHFAAGVALYLVAIVFALLMLWVCAVQFQRWSYWRGRAPEAGRR